MSDEEEVDEPVSNNGLLLPIHVYDWQMVILLVK